MKRFLLAVSLLTGFAAQAQTYNERAEAYIRQYRDLAMAEQRRSGVPAAITLAQGIHETQAGASELATQANNHFGIKCKKSWQGPTFAHTDDAPNECFRKYGSAGDSYRDHSDYLRSTPRYQSCFALDAADYAGWAGELKKCGYATNPLYASRLVRIIEDFHLQDYTYAALKQPAGEAPALPADAGQTGAVARTRGEMARDARREEAFSAAAPVTAPAVPERAAVATAVTAPDQGAPDITAAAPEPESTGPVYGTAVQRNGLKGFYARKGDVLLEYAIKYHMRYARLLELNDLPDAPLAEDMFVYLEKKRPVALRSTHKVTEGETMAAIAQAEGVQLKQLRTINQMEEDEEPNPGATLQLQTMTAAKPATRISERTAPAYHHEEASGVQDMIVVRDEAAQEAKPVPAAVKAPEETRPQIAAARPERVVKQPVQQQQTTPARQKTYTIADEVAVEEIGKPANYSPRYRSQPAAAPAAQETTPAVADEEEDEPVQAQAPAREKDASQDDFSRLKSQLDKAVYARPSQSAPAPAAAAPAPQPSRPAPQTVTVAAGPSYHTVKQGDTAYSIARQYEISMKQLMDWNHLNFEAIRIGQKLRVK